jgi:nitrite reductase/ring-hydroxylating ferredoxin subunit
MSKVKLVELSDTPEEGTGKHIVLEHPFTEMEYILGLFKVEGKFYVIKGVCVICEGSLGGGELNGLIVTCSRRECLWNIRKGYCKFDRSRVMPTYKVAVEEDGLYIEI